MKGLGVSFWTYRSRRALVMAGRDALENLGHPGVNTGHLLLGLAREVSGLAAHALAEHKVGIDIILDSLRRVADLPSKPDGDWESAADVAHTPLLAHVGLQAASLARTWGHTAVGTEHLLLAVAGVPDCMAARILLAVGVNLAALQNTVLSFLHHPEAPAGPEDGADHPGGDDGRPVNWKQTADILAGIRRTAGDAAAVLGAVESRLRGSLVHSLPNQPDLLDGAEELAALGKAARAFLLHADDVAARLLARAAGR